MDKWLIKRPSGDVCDGANYAIEKKSKLTEESSDDNTFTNSTSSELEDKAFRSRTKSNLKRDRKYQDSYIKFGFTCTLINNEQRPKCVICLEILASESMKPSKLMRHLKTKHPQYANGGEDSFKWQSQLTDESSEANMAMNSTSLQSKEKAFDSKAKSYLKRNRRKYKDSYIKFGFTYTLVNNEQRPKCVICLEVLASESMKPSKFKRHLETKHPQYVNKDEVFFKRHLNAFRANYFERVVLVPLKALRASLEATYLIAKAKKPHNIGESLVLPAAIKLVSVMLGENYSNELKCIPLTRNAVSRRITALSEDIKLQLLDRLRQSPNFAIQLDDSTDVTDSAQLLVYVRYCHDGDIWEDLLFCASLERKATGEEIFKLVDQFLETNELLWSNCIAICTDGATTLTSTKEGFENRVKDIAPHITFQNCMIHGTSLVAKNLQPDVNKVLQDAVSIINFIKAKALNSTLFEVLCKEMGSDNEELFRTQLRWLSHGNVLRRVFDLKDEIKKFLMDCNSSLYHHFMDNKWLTILTYLADIFERLNDFNFSLRNRNTNILILTDKVKAFTLKISLWKNEVTSGNYEMFPCFTKFIDESNVDFDQIKDILVAHLSKLQSNFPVQFPEFHEHELSWIRNPFSYKVNEIGSALSWKEKEQLIDLSSHHTLRTNFKTWTCQKFWISVKKEFPELSKKAVHTLLPFASSYFCENAFSAFIITMNQHSKHQMEANLRVAISPISPRMESIISKIQAHLKDDLETSYDESVS